MDTPAKVGYIYVTIHVYTKPSPFLRMQ